MPWGAQRVRTAALLVIIGVGPALIAVTAIPPSGAEPWPTSAPSCSAPYPVGSSAPRVLASLDLLTPVIERLGDRATLELYDDADHSFHVRAKSGTTDAAVRARMADAIARWGRERC